MPEWLNWQHSLRRKHECYHVCHVGMQSLVLFIRVCCGKPCVAMVSVLVVSEGPGAYVGHAEDISNNLLESCGAPLPVMVSKDLHKHALESPQDSCEANSVDFSLPLVRWHNWSSKVWTREIKGSHVSIFIQLPYVTQSISKITGFLTVPCSVFFVTLIPLGASRWNAAIICSLQCFNA